MRRMWGYAARPLTDPRVRAIATLVLLLAVLVLAWHLVGMVDHSVGMLGGACLTLMAAALIILACGEPTVVRLVPEFVGPSAASLDPRRVGRDPPAQGDVLLL